MKIVSAVTSTAQIAAISLALRDIDLRFYFLWELGVTTGLRISDLLALRVSDLSGCLVTICEKKTKNVREIKLPLEMFCFLKGYIHLMRLSPENYIFFRSHQKKDKPMSRQWAWRVISSVTRNLGLQSIGTHSMRKIYACSKFATTGSILSVQRDLGHKHMSTTLIYLKDLLEVGLTKPS
jgi:integrase